MFRRERTDAKTHVMIVDLEISIVRDVLLGNFQSSGHLRLSFGRLSINALMVSIEGI